MFYCTTVRVLKSTLFLPRFQNFNLLNTLQNFGSKDTMTATDSLKQLDNLLGSFDTNETKENRNDNIIETSAQNDNGLQYALIFQGGAGNISTNVNNAKKRVPMAKVMKQILKSAYNYCQLGLKGELTAIDIVESCAAFENSSHFNAGRGSVFTKTGKHEMEASIMNGKDLKCGAVALLNNIKNPISIATDIMNTTQHIYMSGNGVKQHIQHLLLNDKPYNYYEKNKRKPPMFENERYFWVKTMEFIFKH